MNVTGQKVWVIGEPAKRVRHHQACTNPNLCGICMEVRVPNSSACHTYIMWVKLGHCHFFYVPAVSNVVTTGNGTGTKNVLKWNHVLGFEFSIQ